MQIRIVIILAGLTIIGGFFRVLGGAFSGRRLENRRYCRAHWHGFGRNGICKILQLEFNRDGKRQRDWEAVK